MGICEERASIGEQTKAEEGVKQWGTMGGSQGWNHGLGKGPCLEVQESTWGWLPPREGFYGEELVMGKAELSLGHAHLKKFRSHRTEMSRRSWR